MLARRRTTTGAIPCADQPRWSDRQQRRWEHRQAEDRPPLRVFLRLDGRSECSVATIDCRLSDADIRRQIGAQLGVKAKALVLSTGGIPLRDVRTQLTDDQTLDCAVAAPGGCQTRMLTCCSHDKRQAHAAKKEFDRRQKKSG